jgi:hypothetical protein
MCYPTSPAYQAYKLLLQTKYKGSLAYPMLVKKIVASAGYVWEGETEDIPAFTGCVREGKEGNIPAFAGCVQEGEEKTCQPTKPC